MALLRDVIYKRGPSLADLVKLEINKLNLKALERVTIRFDPFTDNSIEIRKFAHLLYKEEARKSNLKCSIKTEVACDRSEQTVTFELIDGKRFIFKCAHLKHLEILRLLNEHITPLAPKEIEAATVDVLGEKKRRKK